MNSVLIIGIIVSLFFGVVTFISTNNFIFAIIALALSTLYFVLIAMPKLKKSSLKVERFHSCYSFINTFVISLSIKGSIKSALDSTLENMSDDFHKNVQGLEEFNESDKLNYLSQYFKFHIYGLFVNLINLWSEQGGDIIDMSSHLVNEARLIEEYLTESARLNKKHVMEFGVLWLISLSILVILRFALAQFYLNIIKQLYFPFAVLGIVLVCLFTIHIAIMRMTDIQIRGWEDVK